MDSEEGTLKSLIHVNTRLLSFYWCSFSRIRERLLLWNLQCIISRKNNVSYFSSWKKEFKTQQPQRSHVSCSEITTTPESEPAPIFSCFPRIPSPGLLISPVVLSEKTLEVDGDHSKDDAAGIPSCDGRWGGRKTRPGSHPRLQSPSQSEVGQSPTYSQYLNCTVKRLIWFYWMICIFL